LVATLTLTPSAKSIRAPSLILVNTNLVADSIPTDLIALPTPVNRRHQRRHAGI
jgi:hypothetical protein